MSSAKKPKGAATTPKQPVLMVFRNSLREWRARYKAQQAQQQAPPATGSGPAPQA
jgi:hypothetical protein